MHHPDASMGRSSQNVTLQHCARCLCAGGDGNMGAAGTGGRKVGPKKFGCWYIIAAPAHFIAAPTFFFIAAPFIKNKGFLLIEPL